MSDSKCTCGHLQSQHEDFEGRNGINMVCKIVTNVADSRVSVLCNCMNFKGVLND